jgi:hypothetical protein
MDKTEVRTPNFDFLAVHIRRSGHADKVPEQFLCSLNQVHMHAAPINFLRAMLYDPASD